jgi:hypothetical protein
MRIRWDLGDSRCVGGGERVRNLGLVAREGKTGQEVIGDG